MSGPHHNPRTTTTPTHIDTLTDISNPTSARQPLQNNPYLPPGLLQAPQPSSSSEMVATMPMPRSAGLLGLGGGPQSASVDFNAPSVESLLQTFDDTDRIVQQSSISAR